MLLNTPQTTSLCRPTSSSTSTFSTTTTKLHPHKAPSTHNCKLRSS
jgi:hypothetical protein